MKYIAAIVALLGVTLCSHVANTEEIQAHITYVTGSTIYLDVGSQAGLVAGASVVVYRDGNVIATLEVVSVASRRAACKRGPSDANMKLQVGDMVQFDKAAVSPSAPATVATSMRASRYQRSWLRRKGIRGRVAIRFLGVKDKSPLQGGYSEPAFDARIAGPLSRNLRVSVDLRARHTYRPNESVDRTRVYRLLGEWSAGPMGPRLIMGRQVAASFSSVSVFDGALAEWRSKRWSTGAFTGTQPDPITYGFSGAIREHGVYVEFMEDPTGGTRWRLSAAGIGSYEQGHVNREYIALQARWMSKRFQGFALQEFDFNRGWRMQLEQSRVSLTSILLQGRVTLGRKWSIDGGFDNRRSIRLFRNRTTPETEFDDSYRQGAWAGAAFRVANRTRLGVRARRSSGGFGGHATSITGTASTVAPRLSALSLRMRGTSYRNSQSTGWLASASPSLALSARLRAGASLGQRTEVHRITNATTQLNWFSTDFDYVLSYAWLLMGSVEWADGSNEQTTQYHTSLAYRF